MQTLSGVLGGLGIFGLIGAFLVGFLLFGIIPIWAIFDCALSKRGGGTKALVIILLLLFWGLGSLIYSIFSTDSKVLRRLTILAICGLVLLTIFSLSSLTGGAAIHSRIAEKETVAKEKQIVAEFNPDPIEPNSINSFRAIHFVYGGGYPSSAAAAKFSLAGPDPESAVNVDHRIRHLVHADRDNRDYALTQHDFGVIDPVTHDFSKIEIDPLLAGDFSWPNGLAYDPESNEIIVLTSHVYTSFFVFNPTTKAWKKVSTFRSSGFIALAYSPEAKTLYALQEEQGKLAIRKFNRQGAELDSIDIIPSLPIARGQNEYFQMAHSSGKLVLIVPPLLTTPQNDFNKARIFVIDPKNGKLFASKKN